MAEAHARPAYYALRSGGLRDMWTLLHPPYTAWHLAYVVIGAALAPQVSTIRLLATLAAFFLAVGVAAHALDELHGRPLRTSIPDQVLMAASGLSLAGALALGAAGLAFVGWPLLLFMVAGAFLVLAYDLEWFHGAIHTDAGFAAAWGSFPVLTGYLAQTGDLQTPAVVAAAAAFALTRAQRVLSNRARLLRRRTHSVTGTVTLQDGGVLPIDREFLLEPLEQALRALSWSCVGVAVALALFRLG
jgi:hypothetical protein